MFENLRFAVVFCQIVLQLWTCFMFWIPRYAVVFHQVVLQSWNYHLFEDLRYAVVFCQVVLQLWTCHMFWRPPLCSCVLFCQVVLQLWTYNILWRPPLCYAVVHRHVPVKLLVMDLSHNFKGPRGKRDGVIWHILRLECENSIKIERYCVIDTSGVIVNNHFVRRENEKMKDN